MWTNLVKVQHLLACLFLNKCEPGVKSSQPGTCLCTDNEVVPVFSQACDTEELKVHTWGACWLSTGETQSCDGREFTQVDYGAGKTAWMESSLLVANENECSGSGGSCGSVRLITREEWGARPPRQETKFSPPMSMVFVHHSAWDPCFDEESCKAMVRRIQDLHMDANGWDDIGYNFLVGEDGNVYEGRGWENQGAQTAGHNTYSYGICLMGDFTDELPTEESQQRVRDMIDCGIQQGHVTLGHEEFGHRDGVCTACPGNTFYARLKTWPRYSTRKIPITCRHQKAKGLLETLQLQ